MNVQLDPAKVAHIRTCGLTDAHLARKYRLSVQTIRRARTGQSWENHPTPPDRSERLGGGRKASAKAKYA